MRQKIGSNTTQILPNNQERTKQMGREIKRVALDFNWPIDTIWEGYINKYNNNWEKFDPPTGEGYQLWSTTTAGHPMSPVFDSPEKLATYLVDNKVSSFADETCTYEQWLRFIKGPGWAPSAIAIDGELKSGVEGICYQAG